MITKEQIKEGIIAMIEITILVLLSIIIYEIVWWYFETKIAPNFIFSKLETVGFLITSFLFVIIPIAISFLVISVYYLLKFIFKNFVYNEIRNDIKYKK